MKKYITASKLYDYIKCPHRVWRDVYGPQEEKGRVSSFVQLLWEKGILHEKKVVDQLGEFLDLSQGAYEERIKKTKEALDNKTPLVYQGVLRYNNMFGVPDLIKLMPDGQYIPIDIKSGMGFEGASDEDDSDGRPKKHYAVQLALYSELLECLGYNNKKSGQVIDIRCKAVEYDLSLQVNSKDKRSFWEFYLSCKQNVAVLLTNEESLKPALAGSCKLCPWYDSCKKWINENDDLTKLFYLGRSKRDIINMDMGIEKVNDILSIDINDCLRIKKKNREYLKGVGEKTLTKIIKRAEVMVKRKKPIAYKQIEFPKASYELYFDIEDDPTQEFVYMHGIYVKGPEGEEYKHFTAREMSEQAEKQAWQEFWDYIRSLPQDDFSVYYYSHHEKTTYRKMQKLYPDVVSEDEVEAFYDNSNVIDLYDIVLKNTDWPVSSYSLKELAQYLGFSWRDETPSGALSIEWFNKYIDTKDESVLNRLLEYNEDDCIATKVLKEGIENIKL
jgi:predicted RecB family nuclease